MKKQGIQREILLRMELFAIVKHFGFYIKPSPGLLICDVVSSKLFLISKWKEKIRKLLTFYFH